MKISLLCDIIPTSLGGWTVATFMKLNVEESPDSRRQGVQRKLESRFAGLVQSHRNYVGLAT